MVLKSGGERGLLYLIFDFSGSFKFLIRSRMLVVCSLLMFFIKLRMFPSVPSSPLFPIEPAIRCTTKERSRKVIKRESFL